MKPDFSISALIVLEEILMDTAFEKLKCDIVISYDEQIFRFTATCVAAFSRNTQDWRIEPVHRDFSSKEAL